MAPSPAGSTATLLALLVVLVLLGMGCPAGATTACQDCAGQCNSTCSAANFAGAGPCGADCNPAPGCPSCLAAYHSKCLPYCVSACKANSPPGYDCESSCNKTSLCSGSCSAVCGESPTCTDCKANYSRGCTSCCTSYCKCHCV
ncbi:hypothetical protein ZWY2020_015169 [Hordeum vulgare]|nr:hypothetical protein ZWY2020_015169 [Hordeum vulgare]